MVTSVYSRESIFFAKFIISTTSFSLIFIPANIFLLLYLYLIHGSGVIYSNSGINGTFYYWYEFIGIITVTQVFLIIHFIAIGAITLLINCAIQNRIKVILCSFSVIILFKIVKVPSFLENYTFFNGNTVTTGFIDFQRSFFTNLQITFSTLAFILLFCLVGNLVFKTKKIV
ncbi:hypothetical protein BpOF4_22014 (plasmid) [Alkalihalophilus pseudofirmus OF4]|uniref:Uncharacterized protein n=1 Tax=Alkalihalophilus pseudofirmus (strain ATCC BAA-2126 / JCM 17055 / OF4) TaxID=398511 RepID=D3G222_ALKPO|nr:hypothetical protein BpOF4_22014 [Alkalihalophilus pseudofirmus OF4]